jgi:hypothetical protein
MISKDKQYRTRDGREVRIYATDGEHNQAVHGAVKTKGEWMVYAWYSDGVYARSDRNGRHDLIEVKPRHKRTVWLNVYQSDGAVAFSSKQAADTCSSNRIACIKVDLDFEEGEGL